VAKIPIFLPLKNVQTFETPLSPPYPSKITIGSDLIIHHLSIPRGFISFDSKIPDLGKISLNSGHYRLSVVNWKDFWVN
jgi:hypothetical protein